MKNPKNPLIFIIDKSSAYRMQIQNRLAEIKLGNLRCFESIEDCLSCAGTPDIIILDDKQQNDSMSGIDFLRIYQKRYNKAEFFFFSSNTNLDDAVSAIKLGASDYIVKSKIGLNRLVKRVEKLIKIKASDKRKKAFLRASVLSLGTLSFILVLAVILYNS